jgi:hypothetical protein
MPCTLCGNNGHNRRTCQRWDLLLDARQRENMLPFIPNNNAVVINDNSHSNIIQHSLPIPAPQLPTPPPPISRNIHHTDISQISDYDLLKQNYDELKTSYRRSRNTIKELQKQTNENNTIIQDLLSQKKCILTQNKHYKEENDFLEFQNEMVIQRFDSISTLLNIPYSIDDPDITDEQFKTIVQEKTSHIRKHYFDNKLKLIQLLYSQTQSKFDCPICIETIHPHNLFVSDCGHSFCLSCIKQIHKNECPMCRHSIGPFIK